ncbi:MAG: hypothetical protein RMJ19_13580 [Gemmatales bacterium]|nr:hypothetical protein [Gemmatales bacterium]MCS7161498.1 hypothetical protein [Gemmatales bacterium]MDW8176701.1 hypothetical protein [Gemmatales bacterium]MDW8221609.1 hypothetical protein [Gemmatales bacterium]
MDFGFTPQQYGHAVALLLGMVVLVGLVAKVLLSPRRLERGNRGACLLIQGMIGVMTWQIVDLTQSQVPESLRPGTTLAAMVLACVLCGLAGWMVRRGSLPTGVREILLMGLTSVLFVLGAYGASSDTISLFEEKDYLPPSVLSGADNHQLSEKQAYTDRGRVIALHTPRNVPAVSERKLPDPSVYWPENAFGYKLIRTAPPDPSYNCHGWIFTAGQYILAPDDVQRILEDNGYYEVHDPKPNDIVVYYDHQGMITHTALVRAVGEEGFLLVESKWGCSGGRYLHLPDLWFAARYVYYRTNRGSHVVKGLNQSPPRLPLAVQPR